jgi:hypothetical protein
VGERKEDVFSDGGAREHDRAENGSRRRKQFAPKREASREEACSQEERDARDRPWREVPEQGS